MTKRLRGVGIGLRHPHFGDILETSRRIDWLEVVPENFVGIGGTASRVLDDCLERWTMVSHGVSMSIGGPDALDEDYLRGLRQLCDRMETPFYSDHLCYSAIDDIQMFDLLPLPFTDEAVEHAGKRIRHVADRLERDMVIENITYYATMPGSRLTEGEFVHGVVETADCGLLLDVNNVYCNAINHGRDPVESLFALPWQRAKQVHLAGFLEEESRLLDDHGSPVADGVWALYRTLLERAGPIPTLIEWDTNIPDLDRVIDEADRARAIMDEVCPGWENDA
ncbi:MAG: DUF692 domain-containing protein [Nannocystaceae bacterium]|nr:DUF692 domain-containing protein [Nannocystaceae bacterium]